MKDSVIITLRALLIVIFLGALLGQTIIVPSYAADAAARFPEVSAFATPYALVVDGGILCLQIALLAIWLLLSRVQRRAIFTVEAFRWVSLIIWAAASATILVLLLGVHLLGIVGVGGPGVLLAVTGAVVCGAAFVLLMTVMRDLLRNATRLDSELAEVV